MSVRKAFHDIKNDLLVIVLASERLAGGDLSEREQKEVAMKLFDRVVFISNTLDSVTRIVSPKGNCQDACKCSRS